MEVKGRIYADTDIRWHGAGLRDFSVEGQLPATSNKSRYIGDILRLKKKTNIKIFKHSMRSAYRYLWVCMIFPGYAEMLRSTMKVTRPGLLQLGNTRFY